MCPTGDEITSLGIRTNLLLLLKWALLVESTLFATSFVKPVVVHVESHLNYSKTKNLKEVKWVSCVMGDYLPRY